MTDICAFSSKSFITPPKNSYHFSLHLIKEGSAQLEIDNEYLNIEVNNVLCLNDQQDLKVLNSKNLNVYTIIFNPTFLNHNFIDIRLNKKDYNNLTEKHCLYQLEPFLIKDINKHLLFPSFQQFNFLENCFYNLYNQLQLLADTYSSCRVRTFFIDIISGIEKLYYNFDNYKNKIISDDLFTKIVSYINDNLNNNLKVTDICKEFSINRNKLQKLFNDKVNTSYYQYIKKLRIQKACQFLKFTNLTVSEIGYRLGFASIQNFCRFFKTEFGMSPGDYKQLNN